MSYEWKGSSASLASRSRLDYWLGWAMVVDGMGIEIEIESELDNEREHAYKRAEQLDHSLIH